LRFLLLAAACLLLAAGCFPGAAQAQIQSDWERANEDRLRQSGEKPVPPPPLNRSRLVELKQELARTPVQPTREELESMLTMMLRLAAQSDGKPPSP